VIRRSLGALARGLTIVTMEKGSERTKYAAVMAFAITKYLQPI